MRIRTILFMGCFLLAAGKASFAAEELEAEQKKLAAREYKQEQILRGEGDAERKRLVLQADGALEQKLETYEAVMAKFAVEFGKQKWVPEIQFNSGAQQTQQNGTSGNEAANLINLLTAQALKSLNLDMTVPRSKSTAPDTSTR